MNSRVKNLIFWVVVGLFMILLFNLFTFQGQSPDEEVKFSEFVGKVEQGDVREVTIRGNYINGLFKDGRPFRTYMVEYPDLVKVLRDHHVTINAKPPEDNPWYVTLLVTCRTLRGRIRRVGLIVAPPGTGESIVAQAVGAEAGVAFFRISGSDVGEMFVGVGASRVRDLFEEGKKHAPCMIFIDEICAVGR